MSRTRAPKGIRNPKSRLSMVCVYHKWMVGVDAHDQLRLQRYSIQMHAWCKKYYKSIMMGLVDVAVVNVTRMSRCTQVLSAPMQGVRDTEASSGATANNEVLVCNMQQVRKSSYLTNACSTYLCERIWPQHYPSNVMTCSQIWYY
ncbi:hypothetical protein PHMEG_0003123 [Phytophthora megakarya]|uniref:PiggyBac transposable element-derived protein domain-containing protein n=1 Tax=Phytophthora megakarya TaxID=4795 RepID=A0A225WZA1_9STRA|nr:hypothetical protein PHMEG_0003123 [Phytophthora megakarya]